MRSIEQPFDVQDSALWREIRDVSCKGKKLTVHKNGTPEHVMELTFLNKKTATVAQQHVRQYLAFIGQPLAPEPSSWFGRMSQRIRKSYVWIWASEPAITLSLCDSLTRRSTSRGATSHVHSPSSEKSPSLMLQHKSTAPSTIPESSFISEDVMDNPISMVEPSLKTNSTYDVSLGSDNSYRPTLTSLSNEELCGGGGINADKLSSFQKQPHNDDRVSMKTTSTYEVSLDSRQMIGKGAAGNDNDSLNAATGQLGSFGAAGSAGGGSTSSSGGGVAGGGSGYRTSPTLVTPVAAMSVGKRDAAPAAIPFMVASRTDEGVVKLHDESPLVTTVLDDTMTQAEVAHHHDDECHTWAPLAAASVIPAIPAHGQGPIPAIPAHHKATPPEIPTRTVTEYVAHQATPPEPPVRMIPEPVPDRWVFRGEQDMAQGMGHGGGVAGQEEAGRKLSMTIEPIKEEEMAVPTDELLVLREDDAFDEEAVDEAVSEMSETVSVPCAVSPSGEEEKEIVDEPVDDEDHDDGVPCHAAMRADDAGDDGVSVTDDVPLAEARLSTDNG